MLMWLGVLLVVAIFLYRWNHYKYWTKLGVYTPKPNLVFGNVARLLFNRTAVRNAFTDAYTECKQKGHKMCGFFIFGQSALLVTDPELVKGMLVRDFSHFTDRQFYVNEQMDPLSSHLVSLKGLEWKIMKDTMSQAFTPSKLKVAFQAMMTVGKNLENVLDENAKSGEPIDITEVALRYAIDIISTCIYGIQCCTLKNENMDIYKNSKRVFGGSVRQTTKLFMSLFYPKILDYLRIPFNNSKTVAFYLGLTRQVAKLREDPTAIRDDLMQQLISFGSSEKNGHDVKSLTEAQIAANAMLMFGTGTDVTASAITFIIYELTQNQHINDKLRQENRRVLSKYNDKITFEALMEMCYLEQCIKESARKYSALPGFSRVCTKTYQFPGTDVTIKEGTSIIIPTYDLHHDPDYFPNPDTFDPDRFLPENSANRTISLGFGDGPRNCIGMRFAILKIKYMLATILQRYNCTISPKTDVPMQLEPRNAILKAKGEMGINLEKKWD